MKIIHQHPTQIQRIISLVLRRFGFLEANTILRVRLSQWRRSTGLIMLSIVALIAVMLPFCVGDSAFATSPTLTVSIPDPVLDLIVLPKSSDGTFASSADMSFTVTTDNYSGYTLSIASGTTGANETNLVSSGNALATLPANSSLTAEAFATATYKNKWGYKPSKLNSAANTTYRPSPTSTGDLIENYGSAGTNISYTISIGANVGLDQPLGEYTNTFVITAVANLTSYSITYNANDGNSGNDTTNMPSPNPQTGNVDTNTTSITLASAPSRNGYDFMGWCTVQVADDAACTGTEYTASDTYNINFQGTNTFMLYARWAEARQTLYDTVAAMSKGKQTNDDNATTGIQAAITVPTSADRTEDTSNSGVYEYDPTVFGVSSDASNDYKIYYYRGVLENSVGSYGSDGSAVTYPNYVILDADGNKTTADTCWRIVRTTGSGGVKMVYNGKWTGSTCANATTKAQVTTKAFNGTSSTYQQIVRVGYTYNETYAVNTAKSGTIAEIFGTNSTPSVNNKRSDIKEYIEDTWYAGNMTDYTSILEPSAGYCNDRTMNTSTSWTTPLAESSTIAATYGTSGLQAYYFGAYPRNMSTAQPPSLTCATKGSVDRSTVDLYRYVANSTGVSNELKYPVALLTADEMSFAGSGRSTASQGSSYHANSYLRSGSLFWLLSPYLRYSGGNAVGFHLSSNGTLNINGVGSANGVRPAISLTSGTTAASGSGTATDPWVVTAP